MNSSKPKLVSRRRLILLVFILLFFASETGIKRGGIYDVQLAGLNFGYLTDVANWLMRNKKDSMFNALPCHYENTESG
jgi:hypothetical protein